MKFLKLTGDFLSFDFCLFLSGHMITKVIIYIFPFYPSPQMLPYNFLFDSILIAHPL